MTYGVIPTGFSRPTLATILAQLEAANIALFGPGIIQTAASPMGQMNGLMADMLMRYWEYAEETYHSYDPDQAEGVRLDALARLRIMARGEGETDEELRQAITNQGRARIDLQDVLRAVRGIDGVTYVQVYINDTATTDENGLSAHSVGVAVIGGDDSEIAQALRTYIVPGIGTSGNLRIDTEIEGVCRSIWLVRPTDVPITLEIEVVRRNDRLGCPPSDLLAIKEGLIADLTTTRRLNNGDDVTLFAIRSAIEARYPNVEVMSVEGSRDGDPVDELPITIAFDEIASFAIADLTIANYSS